MFLQREANVRVTAPVDDKHRTAALKVLSTPDTLLSLALVGDQFEEGTKAIEAAAADPVLKSHFAIVHAKLLLSGPTVVDPEAASALIQDSTVMSFDEIESVCDLLYKRFQPASIPHESKPEGAVLCLQQRIRMLQAEGSIEADRAQRTWVLLQALLKPPVAQPTGGPPGPPGGGGGGPGGIPPLEVKWPRQRHRPAPRRTKSLVHRVRRKRRSPA